jgi:hypothetical protein
MKKCEFCNGSGWYGDNGPGIRGNREYVPCGCLPIERKNYKDIDGNPCTLLQLIRKEPKWAENIIKQLRSDLEEAGATLKRAKALEVTLLNKLDEMEDEIRYLRQYGNKMCTDMADAARAKKELDE